MTQQPGQMRNRRISSMVTAFLATGVTLAVLITLAGHSASGRITSDSETTGVDARFLPPTEPINSPPPSLLGSEVAITDGEGWSLGAQDSDVGLVFVFHGRNGATDVPYVGLARPTCGFGAMDVDTSTERRQYVWWGVTSSDVARVRFGLDDGSVVDVVPSALPETVPEHDSYKWLTLSLLAGVQTTDVVGYRADGSQIPTEDCRL